MNSSANQPSRRGLGQVEVVVSSLIVGVVVVGALNVLGAATRTNRIAANQLDAPGLAHQLMGEILARPYEDPEEPGSPIGLDTGETNTTRADFDDLDDYHTWAAAPPVTLDGTPVPGTAGWERRVVVKYFDPTTGNFASTDTGFKQVLLKILPPGGGEFKLQALRSKWGSLQQQPGADTTVVTSLDAELQIGSTAAPARASIHLKNHAHD